MNVTFSSRLKEYGCGVLTLSPSLDGAAGSDSMAILVPVSRHVLQRHLTHKDSILVLLDVQIFKFGDHFQLLL